MKTTRELMAALEKVVRVRVEDIVIDAKVVDVKTAYGNILLQIEPYAGYGAQWVSIERVIIPTIRGAVAATQYCA